MNLLQLHEPGESPLPHAESANSAIGIDLGTTHSVVAIANAGKVEIIRDEHGAALIPSIVSYVGNEPLVGILARDQRAQGEAQAIASIKRLMGRGATDLEQLTGMLPFSLAKGEGVVRVRVGNRELTPVEISADILRHMKRMAERALGHDVTQSVITVPAYFDDAARTATKDAARLAGLTVLRLVSEPTAAALAYGLDTQAEGIYAVYDLGGGTFDISLLKLEQGVFQVLATGGDAALGGDDFDQAIARAFCTAHHIPALSEGETGALLSLARETKEALSSAPVATLSYMGFTHSFTREDMEALIAPFIDKTIQVTEQALFDARLTPADIKGVVPVGGSTRIPLVREKLAEFFERDPLSGVNPDEVVAVGAAIQAEALSTGSGSLLLDVIPLSLGLETMGGLVEKLLHRNTPIPVSTSQEFTTYQDGQSAMKIHVLQGEREMVNQNRSLARFELKDIPPLPAGLARIRIIFTVDADGLLTVSAMETTTGTEQTVHVKPSYGLEPEEISRMLEESMVHAQADITGRLLVEARVEAERSIIEVKSALKVDGDLLSEPERTLIDLQMGYVMESLKEEDRDRIDVEVQQLAHATHAFAERRMDRAITKALKGSHINTVEKEIAGDKNA